MTETELRQFLEGLLTAWDVDAEIEAGAATAGVSASLLQSGAEICRVSRSVEPFGVVWQVAAPGEKPRAHPSAQGAIRTLGGLLAPDRPMGRVRFATGMEGAP